MLIKQIATSAQKQLGRLAYFRGPRRGNGSSNRNLRLCIGTLLQSLHVLACLLVLVEATLNEQTTYKFPNSATTRPGPTVVRTQTLGAAPAFVPRPGPFGPQIAEHM